MRIIRKTMLCVFVFMLAACAVKTIGFDNLSYPITSQKIIGKLVLIIPVQAAQSQVAVPAKMLNTANDQLVSVGQMLVTVADYEYPKIFSSYDRVSAMSDIKPGFYRAIMRLNVENFTADDGVVQVGLHANMYSYQGKLLYEKTFIGQAKIVGNFEAAALSAYRDAMQQVNDRLEQVLYWEDHADAHDDKSN